MALPGREAPSIGRLSVPPPARRTAAREGEVLPLSYQQAFRLMMERQGLMGIGSRAGLTPSLYTSVEIEGPLSVGEMQAAVDAVVARHETLRVRFFEQDGEPKQEVLSPRPAPLDVIDVPDVGPEQQIEVATARATELVYTPITDTSAPLLRTALFPLARCRWLCLLYTPHIVADAWTMRVILHELASLLNGTPPDQLRPPDLQYGDYVLWQHGWLSSAGGDRVREYYEARLRPVAPLALPSDFPPQADASLMPSAAVSTFMIQPALASAVAQAGTKYRSTPLAVMLAACNGVLGLWTGQDHVVVVGVLPGRPFKQLASLVGYCTNICPIRTDINDDPTLAELIQRSTRSLFQVHEYDIVPYLFLRQLALERGILPPPRTIVTINYLGGLERATAEARSADRVQVTRHDLPLILPGGSLRTSSDMNISLVPKPDGGFAGRILYRSLKFSEPTIRTFIDRFERMLDLMARQPETRLSAAAGALDF